MGGQLAVELAIERPDEFRAVIGLESGLSRARMAPTLDFHDHPRISNEFRMQSMYGKTAPGNPEKYRREIAWTYGQSAPPVSKGDLYYNFIDHNLTGGEAQRIDTSRIAVYLMTGEYDWGNSPDQTSDSGGTDQRLEVCRDERPRPLPNGREFCGVQNLSDADTGRDCDERRKVIAPTSEIGKHETFRLVLFPTSVSPMPFPPVCAVLPFLVPAKGWHRRRRERCRCLIRCGWNRSSSR